MPVLQALAVTWPRRDRTGSIMYIEGPYSVSGVWPPQAANNYHWV